MNATTIIVNAPSPEWTAFVDDLIERAVRCYYWPILGHNPRRFTHAMKGGRM